jgi:peptide/nickel transport system permease protein
MRAVDIFMSVPSILMQMTIIVTLGQNVVNLCIAMAVVLFPPVARLVRSTILTIRDSEFVAAARSYGASSLSIMIKHVLPNSIGVVIVQTTLSLGAAILAIAGMGFIGLGVPAPTPEWGTILSENRDFIRYYPYLGIIPGLAIGISVMALNFVGDGLRDALDPRTKK